LSEYVVIGTVTGAFGLKGEVKVEPNTEFEERFEPGRRVRIGGVERQIVGCRWHQERALLLLEGVTDVDAAKALQFQRVEALASERPELDEDEYLLEDLVGLPVRTEDGTELGTVENVLAYPAQDLLKVGDLLIPFIEEFVLECDLESGLVVKLLPGMEPGAD